MNPVDRSAHSESRFPTRTFSLGVAAVCVLIALSSLYTYRLLDQLYGQFLDGRGEDVAASIDLNLRGPRRRPDPNEWRRVFEENLDAYSGSVVYLALVDEDDRALAFAGFENGAGGADFERLRDDPGVWKYQRDVVPRGQGSPPAWEIRGWKLIVGLRTEPAAFIRRAAYLHLATAALGVLSLIGLSVYFYRAWAQLLRLRSREESERHLASLGRLSATLAHEIRNPLGAIKGLTQVVQEQLPAEGPAKEHLQTVVEEAERLEKLVRDLLLFARPQEPRLSEVGLAEEADAVRRMMEPELALAGVRLRIESPDGEIRCQSDRDGLHQVLLNVARNALEASPPESEILVSVSRKGRFGRIVIEDQGAGLTEDPATLFEPFKTSKLQGTGLGLSVSKQIVERLGGGVELENRPQGGARCTISLPL